MRNGNVFGKQNTASTLSASGIWKMNDIYNSVKNGSWPGGRIPPVGSGLIALYDGNSWNGSQWSDVVGSYHATSISGTISSSTTTGNGATGSFTTLTGNTSSRITFPSGILPSTYTLFHVTRLTGGSRARIVTSTSNNWLSGHWGGGSGIAYHEGWLTGQPDTHGNNWVLSTDQNSLYRSNGVTRGTGGGAYPSLSINTWSGEYSDWQCAFICVYNRTLNSTEYGQVESWLSAKYGITI